MAALTPPPCKQRRRGRSVVSVFSSGILEIDWGIEDGIARAEDQGFGGK